MFLYNVGKKMRKIKGVIKGEVVGIIFLFVCSCFLPCLAYPSNTPIDPISMGQEDLPPESQAVKITCYTIGIPGANPIQSAMVSTADAAWLIAQLKSLKYETSFDPQSEHVKNLQNELLIFAETRQLLSQGTSALAVQTALKRTPQLPENFLSKIPLIQGRNAEWFCNFATFGEGSATPIIILPRFIPILLTPIPRAFVYWSTPDGYTSVGGLISRTGFIAYGEQKGIALGFWGIGFSVFLPPIMSYGIFGYALYSRVTAEQFEFWPPNSPPEITQTDPADGEQLVSLSTTQLRFSIDDANGDLMSYTVTTDPDIGSGSGGLKPSGTYSVPISGLESLTTYTWHIQVTDGKDTVEKTMTFTTEPIAPVISNPVPSDGERDVPMDIPSLQFTLRDYQGDTIEFTVQTSPNIGSDHKIGVHDGTYTVPISGLTYGATYRWYVNATDGTHWTRKTFIFETGYPSQYNPFEFGWQYRKQITINHTYVAENLENFPVVISTIDTDLNKAQVDGSDILFMDGPGVSSRLYHEIETFDQSSGEFVAFVNLPALSSTQDTVLYLYYGNPSSINQQYPEKVWNSHFKAVWHLQESPSGIIHDSTTNNNDATSFGSMGLSDIVDGKVGKSLEFDGIDDYLSIPDSASLKPTDLTFLCWLNVESPYGEPGRGWVLGKRCVDSFGNQDAVSYGMSYDSNYLGTYAEKNDNTHTFAKYKASLNIWYYSAMTFNSATENIQYYQNGTLSDTMNHCQSLRYIDPREFIIAAGHINEGSSLNYWVHCKIDEIWLLDTPLSSGWISTAFHNQNDPANFLNFGPEEGP
jgi:hypothetical protein